MDSSDVSKYGELSELIAIVSSTNDKGLRELLLKRLLVAEHESKFSEYDLQKIQAEMSIESAIYQARTAIAVEKFVAGTVGRKEEDERRWHEAIGETLERNRKSS